MRNKAYSNYRFWEIDYARGIAIVMMIIYHILWDI
ncbi:MAG: heparan-alpha-glucosaminide N-acetyltransferase domain-containing protein, partial [Candidatus Woesearchaeota archaeon]